MNEITIKLTDEQLFDFAFFVLGYCYGRSLTNWNNKINLDYIMFELEKIIVSKCSVKTKETEKVFRKRMNKEIIKYIDSVK